MSDGSVRYWVRGTDQKTYGPVDVPTLQAWAQKGTVTAESLVSREDDASNQWIRASGIVGLNLGAAPAAQAPPVVMAAPMPTAEQQAQAQKAKTMVMWSHVLGWGGIFLLFGGSGVFAVMEEPGLAGMSALVGILSAVGGAILGQVGRALQGRVI